MRTAAKRAGILDFSPHVCRHTFATRLAEKGVDLRTIQELGRWASLSMVQRYSNITERHNAEAVETLSAGLKWTCDESEQDVISLQLAQI